eukprot:TRINITY_DN20273_c1_g1_i1.p1 TRINITY_DN20273_c1_g1~~TRINITY_DN20273_c1_g1_i1.p1  ORF type:complete len:705 (-),score=147.02 TRINITY_DN20273_c1_g1_i1:113-2227(-)
MLASRVPLHMTVALPGEVSSSRGVTSWRSSHGAQSRSRQLSELGRLRHWNSQTTLAVGVAGGLLLRRSKQRHALQVSRAEPVDRSPLKGGTFTPAQGRSMYEMEAEQPSVPLDLLPKMGLKEEDEMKIKEPAEPCLVIEVHKDDELVFVRGGRGLWTDVEPGTFVTFEEGEGKAILLAWKEDIAVLHLVSGDPMPGEECMALHKYLDLANPVHIQTRVGYILRGRILDREGNFLDGLPEPEETPEIRNAFAGSKPLNDRSNKYGSFFTGIQGIDFSVPIGRGQTMLFQGTDIVKDRRMLWPDLMCSKPERADGTENVNVAVCQTMEEAEEMRSYLQAKGVWEQCAIFVTLSESPGAAMLTLNAAMAFAEFFCDKDGDAMVLGDLRSMSHLWFALSKIAGTERIAKGILTDPTEEKWVEMQGTVVRESIAERRKFWFALVSRAVNEKDHGSVSLMAWLWEKTGGIDQRELQAYEQKLERIAQIPRITDEMKQKMLDKVKADMEAEGLQVQSEDGSKSTKDGVPNWEIEEMKSITDGHVLLRRPADPEAWSWSVDLYRSLPRLGTGALHRALISANAHQMRLKMMQGRDRANLLHDAQGSANTIDSCQGLDIRFLELLLEQPAGQPLTVEQEVARLLIVAEPNCANLKGLDGTPDCEALVRLSEELLNSEAGQELCSEIQKSGLVSDPTLQKLRSTISEWVLAPVG